LSFRILDQLVTYFDNAGVVLAGGTVTVTLTGTDTETTVYLDPDLADEAANPLGLDSAGRPDTELWGDSSYRVRMKNAAGTTIKVIDNVRAPTSSDNQLPAFVADAFLTNDGATASWAAVSQVPDTTGSEDRVLTVVGGVAAWAALPTQTYDEDNLPGGLVDAGAANGYFDFGQIRVAWGTDTAPTASGITTSKAVTFAQAFASTPWVVLITPGAQNVTSEDTEPSCSYSGASTTGVTAHFFCGGENAGAGTTNITSSIPFSYLVVGPKP
jgi:hypothetical protein